jgi:hypothetical protein
MLLNSGSVEIIALTLGHRGALLVTAMAPSARMLLICTS